VKTSRAFVGTARLLDPGMVLSTVERDQSHSPLIDGEPLFIIRGRDSFAIPVLLLLKLVYDISDEEIKDWYEWQEGNNRMIRWPRTMKSRFNIPSMKERDGEPE